MISYLRKEIPGRGNGNPLQYPCWENPIDRGAWWAVARGITKSWTTTQTVRAHVKRKTCRTSLRTVMDAYMLMS